MRNSRTPISSRFKLHYHPKYLFCGDTIDESNRFQCSFINDVCDPNPIF